MALLLQDDHLLQPGEHGGQRVERFPHVRRAAAAAEQQHGQVEAGVAAQAGGTRRRAATISRGTPTISRMWILIARSGSPASRAARARRRASPPSGSSTATGGSYRTSARNADGAAKALSRATTAPEEWPTSSGRSPAAAATASTSPTSPTIASAPDGAASAWPSR